MAGQLVIFDENDRVVLRGNPEELMEVTRPGKSLLAYAVYWPANRGNPAYCSIGAIGSGRDIELEDLVLRRGDLIEITEFNYMDRKADPRYQAIFESED